MCAQKIIFVNFARAGLIMRCYRPWYKNKRGRGDFYLLQIDRRLSNSCIARLVVGCEECGRLLAVAFRPKTPIQKVDHNENENEKQICNLEKPLDTNCMRSAGRGVSARSQHIFLYRSMDHRRARCVARQQRHRRRGDKLDA